MIPSISILLPARGRPDNLRASVGSLYELASAPDALEVLVRLDEDDPYLDASLRVLRGRAGVVVGTGPRLGYGQMNDYYDQLAARALGEWLFLWNDDIEMISAKWDEALRDAPPFSIQFPRRDITASTDFTLPALGRPVYEALGRMSENAYCDAWIVDVATAADVAVIRDDIIFRHHRLDDQTMRDQAQHQPGEWAKFHTQKAARVRDVGRLLNASEYAARYGGWRTGTFCPQLDYLTSAAPEFPKARTLLGRLS